MIRTLAILCAAAICVPMLAGCGNSDGGGTEAPPKGPPPQTQTAPPGVPGPQERTLGGGANAANGANGGEVDK